MKWNGVGQQALGTFLGAFNNLLVGFTMGYVPVFLDSFREDPDVPFTLTEIQEGWFASLVTLGAVLGCMSAATLTYWFGRKRILIALLLPYSVTWLPTIFPTKGGPLLMLIGRFFVGIVFLGFPVGQLLIGEVTHPDFRGFFSYWGMIGITIGMLINFVLAFFMNWRGLAIFNAVFPWIFLPLFLMAKESPIWLLTKGRDEEARENLFWYRGRKPQECSPEIEEEFQMFKTQIAENYSKQDEKGLRGYLTLLDAKYRRPVAVLCFLMIGRQFSGVYAILSFQTDIFEEAGSSVDPLTGTTIMGVIQLVCLLLAGFLTDRIGRKVLTVYGTILMGMASAIFGLHAYAREHAISPLQDAGWLPLLCLVAYIGGFSIGIGPSAFALLGEILPPQIKNPASSLATALNDTASFLTILLYYPMEDGITKAGVFWFYSICCYSTALICMLTLTETKGKTLADIERIVTASSFNATAVNRAAPALVDVALEY